LERRKGIDAGPGAREMEMLILRILRQGMQGVVAAKRALNA